MTANIVPAKPISKNVVEFRRHTIATANYLSACTKDLIEEISRPKDRYKVKDYKELLETEPLSKACCELKALRAVSTFGAYEHEEKSVQEWVRGNFESMYGNLNAAVRDLTSALPVGFSCAEIVWSPKMPGFFGEWRLSEVRPLDPEKIRFAGTNYRLTHVIYVEKDGEERWIPYKKCLHVVNGSNNFANPYGSGEAKRAMPYYRLKNLLFSEMAVAGKNNATGILFGQADSNDTVIVKDSEGHIVKGMDGNPRTMNAVEALNLQLQNLESTGVITSDLKTRLQSIVVPSGDNFWNFSLMLVKKELLLSFLTPSLIWDEGSFGGLGNTGMSGNHKNTLDANISAIVAQIQEEILEKIVRPLLVYNKPIALWKRNWGAFKTQPYSDPNFMMSQAGALISAISAQVLPTSDIDVVNALRQALGVPVVSDEQNYQLTQQQIRTQVEQQNAMMQGQPAEQPSFSYWGGS
jgi:hypothetical protein